MRCASSSPGSATFWGSRLAQALEHDPDVEVVVGVDTRDPRVPLERTEFVRTDSSYSILARIVRATQVDTILHTHLIVDSTEIAGRALHEINVIGTMNLLAAAGAPGSPVRKVVLKSSALVYGANYKRPVLLPRGHGAHAARRAPTSSGRCSRSRRSCATSPTTTRTSTSRSCASRTCSATTSTRRSRPRCAARSCPRSSASIRALQFVHEDDVVGALMYATTNDVPGVYNVAGDGNMPWSEVCAIVGKRRVAAAAVAHRTWRPSRCACCALVGPPARGAAAAALRPRRSTTARFKRAGFRYQYTTAGTVEAFARGLRLARDGRRQAPDVPYEREVETSSGTRPPSSGRRL